MPQVQDTRVQGSASPKENENSLEFNGGRKMYKATNIDTDKALEALNESREYQAKASQIRMEKERSYMEGGA